MSATFTSGSFNLSFNMSFSAGKTISGLANPITNGGNNSPVSNYTFGSGSGKANQCVIAIISIALSTTYDLVLTAGSDLKSILGDASPTLSIINELFVELLAADQVDAQSSPGTAASSITLGAAGSNPWITGPFGATDTYTMFNGDKWWASSREYGFPVASTKQLQIVNNDSGVAAKVQVTIYGLG